MAPYGTFRALGGRPLSARTSDTAHDATTSAPGAKGEEGSVGKRKKDRKNDDDRSNEAKASRTHDDGASDDSRADGPLKRKDYEEKLEKLHVELVQLQQWVQRKGRKVC